MKTNRVMENCFFTLSTATGLERISLVPIEGIQQSDKGSLILRRKWSKEKIVQKIQELRNQKIDLSAGNIVKNYVPLFTAATSKRYFSSWANAVKAAGIDYSSILEAGKNRRRELLTKWSKEQVLEEIRKADSQDLLKTYHSRLTLYSAARREFGSWKEALEAAGYRLTKGSHKNSNRIFRSEEAEKMEK